MRDIYEAAIQKYGAEHQHWKTVEECGELVVAITQSMDGRNNEQALLSEIADVEIMIEQMRIIYGDKAIDAEKDKKLKRLAGRVWPQQEQETERAE